MCRTNAINVLEKRKCGRRAYPGTAQNRYSPEGGVDGPSPGGVNLFQGREGYWINPWRGTTLLTSSTQYFGPDPSPGEKFACKTPIIIANFTHFVSTECFTAPENKKNVMAGASPQTPLGSGTLQT